MKKIKANVWIISAVILVLILWGSSWYLIDLRYGEIEGDGRGTFGDMFGAVNALFSGFAFAGLIYTINVQRKELSLQREELSLQRDEIRQSTAELAGQKEQMIRQRFENTYFNLLSMQNDIVSSIQYVSVVGRSVFVKYHVNLKDGYVKLFDIEKAANQANEIFGFSLEHYYNNIVSILDFVSQEPTLTSEEKFMYIGFLRSQISPYEYVYLYYKTTYNEDYLNRQRLIQIFFRYGFFSRLNKSYFLDPEQFSKSIKDQLFEISK